MPTEITLNQLLMIGFIAGFVCGLVPLILGLKNQNRKFAILGFVLCIMVGVPFSLFGALPVAGIFSWLILRKPAEAQTAEAEVAAENQTEVTVKEPENS